MKKSISLITSIVILTIVSGCLGLNQDPIIPQEDIIQVPSEEALTPQESTWQISGTNYTITPVSGSNTATYSGELFTTVKITEIATQKRTYFTSYPGQWSDFEIAREANMFSWQTANTITNNLSNQAFGTLTGFNNTAWYHVQVPIDRTLVVYQGENMVYVLDYDDPSGIWNKMTYSDIQILLQYIEFI